MTWRHGESVERVAEAVLRTPGDTDPALRQAVAAFAAGDDVDLPDDLRPYVAKVAQNAYKVTDDDVEALRAVGYSDDAIFELTLAAALGAAQIRLAAGLEAMS